jgi:N-acetylmuramoyl-L-alanine amidase
MRSFGSVHRFARPFVPTRACVVAVALTAALLPAMAEAQTQAADLYQQARAREVTLRKQVDVAPASSNVSPELLKRMRTLAKTYEDLWRLFPTSGYSDNALWQGAMLSADAFWEFGEPQDRATALRLFQALTTNFPTSSLLKQVASQAGRLESAKVPAVAAKSAAAAPVIAPAAAALNGPVFLKAIRREVLPDTLRVTLELEREPEFHAERIDGPPRVFIDLPNTRAVDTLKDATLTFSDDLVRQIRVGRQIDARIRVVLDLSVTAGRHSVYSLYNPYRIVVDFERKAPGAAPAAVIAPPVQIAAAPVGRTVSAPPGDPDTGVSVAPERRGGAARPTAPATVPAASAKPEPGATWSPPPAAPVPGPVQPIIGPAVSPADSIASAGPAAAAPLPPAANSTGSFSLSRQLGLGISRIVIDAGHGGHDPGAKIRGLTEAEVTLDIALRLEKLFLKQSGVEVILTRRSNAFIALGERTAIANRSGADLFLSIHGNASDNPSLRGIETYFLNLSPNPEAQRIAARENASSSKTMHDFADIVKAIALNDKIDESRDFASAVQASMYEKLRSSNKDTRNLGVKQAPFMVLIGATMPSVLAEISFITNKDEGALLKTEKYRQQIAEALYQGVMRYQQSLKKVPAIAMQDAGRR